MKDHEERGGVRPSNAIDWLRNAFKIVDHLEAATAPDVQKLRVRFRTGPLPLCALTGLKLQISLLRTLGLSTKRVLSLVH